MSKHGLHVEIRNIEHVIYVFRGQRVILDNDSARIYGVGTKVLNQAVKRNKEKFPEDFMFQLTTRETQNLMSQIATSREEEVMRSQSVTASKRNIRYRPYVFTEHGAIMAANVLNSSRAVKMSVFVMRVPPWRDQDARDAHDEQDLS